MTAPQPSRSQSDCKLSVPSSPSFKIMSPSSSRDSSPAPINFSAATRNTHSQKNSVDPNRTSSLLSATNNSTATASASSESTAKNSVSNGGGNITRISRLPAKQSSGNSSPSEHPPPPKTPSWPISPRLKSPSPSSSTRRNLSNGRKPSDATIPRSVPVGTDQPSESIAAIISSSDHSDSTPTQLEPRKSIANPFNLETVEEGVTPAVSDPNASKNNNPDLDSSQQLKADYFSVTSDDDYKSRVHSRTTSSVASGVTEPISKNMTVETETVNPIPVTTTTESNGSTLRVKTGNDTIRPKKERKKASKKPPSITSAPRMSPSCFSFDSSFASLCNLPSPNSWLKQSRTDPFLYRQFPSTPSLVPSRESRKSSVSKTTTSPRSIPFNSAFSSALRLPFRSSTNLSRQVSTRSEVFESRVKREMEDASSDDSDETFVYESNPTDHTRRSKRHSRTPSGASLANASAAAAASLTTSTVAAVAALTGQDISNSHDLAHSHSRSNNRNGGGGSGQTIDRIRPPPKLQKPRSMKFSSTSNYGNQEPTDNDSGDGPLRPRERIGSHFSTRQSRNSTSQSILLDEDNPIFLGMPKTRSLTAVGGGRGSASNNLLRHSRNSSTKRNHNGSSNGYSHFDIEADAADDEYTPLMMGNTGTVRHSRTKQPYSRHPYRAQLRRSRPSQRNLLARIAACLLIFITVSVLAAGVVCFLFALSKPLEFVTVVDINGVIASEQELMFDIVVEAMNPNLVPITVSSLDINCFAKSKYVGSQKWWREHGSMPLPNPEDNSGGGNNKNETDTESINQLDISISPDPDPDPSDPSAGKQTMLLGHILHFDNPLIFDGTFWHRRPAKSIGSVRLSRPGNRTEAGGTARWERVLQHEFDLQIRGVLTYPIPLSGRSMQAPIHAVAVVKGSDTGGDDENNDDNDDKHDNDDDNDGGNRNRIAHDDTFHQWVR